MRRFLYISPCFAPQSRVGALRPLKFARHLEPLGWSPVVLADLGRTEPINRSLLRAVPESTVVIRDYGPGAKRAEAELPSRVEKAGAIRAARRPPLLARVFPALLDNPELIPLQTELPAVPHAVRAAMRALKAHPDCEAIVVNANPFAAMLVGAAVAKRSGLPLIQDLRDPWSICTLRGPLRPRISQWLVQRMERHAFESADAVVINTQTAMQEYRAHYADLPPDRFAFIRNHHDAALTRLDVTEGGPPPPMKPGSLLFLGHFRRHLEGDTLMQVLAALAARGMKDRARVVVTGACLPSTWEYARAHGVDAMIEQHPFVPYTCTGPVMDAADVLIALNNRTHQRIMAKLYDYATTRRPVLVVADSPEIERLSRAHGMAYFSLDDPEGIADWLVQTLASGRPADVERDAHDLSSEVASAKLANILERVCSR